MFKLHPLFLYLLIVIAFSEQSIAAPACQDLFTHQNKPKAEQTHLLPFERLKQSINDLKVSDLLSPEFINKIEESVGPIKITRSTDSGKSGKGIEKPFGSEYADTIVVYLSAGKMEFMSFALQYKKNSDILYVDNLGLIDPTNTKKSDLHLAQTHKGLPIREFNHAKEAILQIAKDTGWNKVGCAKPMTLLVSYLYRKMVRMQPTTESKPYYDYLDLITKSSGASLDVISTSLGTFKHNPTFTYVESILLNKSDAEIIKLGFKPIYISEKLVGYAYNGEITKNKDMVFFFNPFENKPALVKWFDFAFYNKSELILDLK